MLSEYFIPSDWKATEDKSQLLQKMNISVKWTAWYNKHLCCVSMLTNDTVRPIAFSHKLLPLMWWYWVRKCVLKVYCLKIYEVVLKCLSREYYQKYILLILVTLLWWNVIITGYAHVSEVKFLNRYIVHWGLCTWSLLKKTRTR